MPKGPSMLAGLSPDVRQLLAKQVKDAKALPINNVPAMISTQPVDDEEMTGNAGPGPSTIRARSRSEGEEEPASKRRKTNPTTTLPTGEIIKSSWDASDLVKRFTVENWEEEMPEDIKKYFHQRNNLFSRYNTHNILLDHTGWYSVTPEKIAQHIAERCRCDTVLDGFAGVGGNLIAFAWTCERVIAIDTSMERLKIARHNAMQYGVADRIEFICADYVEFVGSWARRKQRQREERGEMEVVVGLGEEVDVIFLSPPWGGTEYLTATNDATDPEASFAIDNHLPPFPLDTLQPLPAKDLYDLSRKMTPNIAFFLPRNSSPNEIALWADETPIDPDNLEVGGKEFVEIEELWMGRSKENPFKPGGAGSKNRRSVGKRGADGKLKALNAYFGGLAGAGEP